MADVEAPFLLFPSMEGRPEIMWPFIRKVYSIVTTQLLAVIAVAATVTQFPSIATFFSSWGGWIIYALIIILLFIVSAFMAGFQTFSSHPLNYILAAIFILCFGLILGLLSPFVSGIIMLEAGVTAAVATVSLILYTLWAEKKEQQDFGFLVPFLFSAIIALLVFTALQIVFPMARISVMICTGVAVLIFCAYIIYAAEILIKTIFYDNYIWASVFIYLNLLLIFPRLLFIPLKIAISCCCNNN